MTVAKQPSTSSANDRPIHGIAFKCTDGQKIVLEALRDTFNPPTSSEAMRWLLSDPDVRQVIGRRVRGES